MFASPWLISDVLVNRAREMNFWGNKNSPKQMQRLKQLMTTKELRSVFKFPIDDNKLIGIDSKKRKTS